MSYGSANVDGNNCCDVAMLSVTALTQAFHDTQDASEVFSRLLLEYFASSSFDYNFAVGVLCDSISVVIEQCTTTRALSARLSACCSSSQSGSLEALTGLISTSAAATNSNTLKEMRLLDINSVLGTLVTTLVRLLHVPQASVAVNAFNRALCLAKGKLSSCTQTQLKLHYASMEGRGIISRCAMELSCKALRDFLEFWGVNMKERLESQLLLQQKFDLNFKNKRFDECLELLTVFRPYEQQWLIDYIENGTFDRLLMEASPQSLTKLASKEKSLQKRIIDLYKKADSRMALHFVKKFKLKLQEYPELLVLQERDSVTYFLYVARLNPKDIVDLFEGYDRLLSHLIVSLCEKRDLESGHPSLGAVIHYAHGKLFDKTNSILASSAIVKKTLSKVLLDPSFESEKKKMEDESKQATHFPDTTSVTRAQQESVVSSSRWLTLKDLSYDICTDLVWVDDINVMDSVLQNLETRQICVALDSEWRPKVCCYTKSSIALLQIAPLNDRYIYLLDLTTMGCQSYKRLGAFFSSPRLVKVGVSFIQNDWREFQKRCPNSFSCISNYHEMSSFLLLEGVLAKTENVRSCHKSLSDWSKLVLNKEMDKSCRLRNWEKRPLLLKAACYAALDVAAIVRILQQAMQNLGLTSFEALLDRVSEAKKSTQRKKLVPRVPATH